MSHTSPLTRRTLVIVLAAGTLAAIVGVAIWRGSTSLPVPGSGPYEEVTRSFYKALAELQVGLLDDAATDFGRATTLVASEPASWANLAIARLRLGDLEGAMEPVARAQSLAPRNADIALLAARLESTRGQFDQAIVQLRKAVALDPGHVRARFALAEELERAGSDEAAMEALMLLDEVQRLAPTNLAIVLERARLSAVRGDAARLRDSLTQLERAAASWPAPAVEQYQALRRAAETGNLPEAARGTAMLRNVLARVPAYSTDLTAVRTAPEIIAEPFDSFLALAKPPSVPAPADETLAYTSEPIGEGTAIAAAALSLDGSDRPVVFTTDGTTIRRIDASGMTWPFPGGPAGGGTLLPIDWNNDFKTDLLAAGAGGVRLLLQREGGAFQDATATAARRASVMCGCSGAWAADLEMDGDLDVILGIADGATIVLRNNGDGTWMTSDTFAAVRELRAFMWADLDRDGDPDAAFLAGDRVRVYLNGRAGAFGEADTPGSLSGVDGMTVADVDSDGTFEIVVRSAAGDIRQASPTSGGKWDEKEVLKAPGSAAPAGGAPALFAADLDNNGAIDLIAAGRIALADDHHNFRWTSAAVPNAASAADFDGDGLMDLLAIGTPASRLRATGSKGYHWKEVRVRAQQQAGDQRINPFAVGGEIEVRSGLLRQKQLLTGAPAHFGLGNRTSIDVARIVWPNGVPQAEFGIRVDDTIVAEQRLKGSCPWVFAFDGREMRFVTDFLWRSPLGLRINAQDTAASQTEDWVRIGGEQLAPRDGMYDVRITAELWETHFFDHVSLLAIDHPAETEAFIDERFSPQPPAFAMQTLRDLRPVSRALDQSGRDVTDLVVRRDGRFLAAFDRGRYQGIATDHTVEIEIDPATPARAGEKRVLVAHGWVYPTDSSINVAVAQGQHLQPRGLSLEYQRPDGTWAVAEPALGFPAGKNKTMLIDLGRSENARRVRLRTNLEVSWDLLASAVSTSAGAKTTRIEIEHADLRYRGYSRTISPRGNAPETPIYAPIASTGQRWRDLGGYYTRFGDVRELLATVDDRYVIMNAGDELALRFPALPAPPAGWRRDFVLVGDGWEKDGDFNTEFSATVLPLPAHGPRPYDPASALRLEDDPVFKRHRADWEHYHTRYVSPGTFASGLTAR